MNPNSLQSYQHSGKFNPLGLMLPLAAAAALGFPLGLAYAYFIQWIPFIYLNIIATCAYGFAFGWVTARILKANQVRNPPLAALCGSLAGLIALYLEWSGHLHVLFSNAPWLFNPDQIWHGVGLLYDEGSWSLHSGSNITGIPLAIVWLLEAGIIVAFAAFWPYDRVKNTPFCEKTMCWLDEEKNIDTLEKITDPLQLAALKNSDIMPITQAKPKTGHPDEFTRLLLKRSLRCNVFCTLRVQQVTISRDKKGHPSLKTKDLTNDLIIPASMFELIAQFEHFTAESVPPQSAC